MLKFGIFVLFVLGLGRLTEEHKHSNSHQAAHDLKCNLTGEWRNHLGSHVTLTEHEHEKGRFNGFYRTAVEIKEGSAGQNKSAVVIAYAHPDSSSVFTLNVFWPKGSATTWIGQCYVTHKGIEVLDTTWLLQSPEKSLQNAWMSTRVGKDTFRRVQL